MKFSKISLLTGVVALGLSGLPAFAHVENNTYETYENSPRGPGASSDSQNTQQAGIKGDAKSAAPEKTSLAPHTLMMETALNSAIEQVKGLRTQYDVAQANGAVDNPGFLSHFQMHSQQIQKDLDLAKTHEGHLKAEVTKYPALAQSQEYKQVDGAIGDASTLFQSFKEKTGSTGYWKNSAQVRTDLDQLEKRLTAARDDTKTFDSTKLDIRNVS